MWIDDQVIRDCYKNPVVYTWIPSKNIVVLGRSNQAELESHVDRCNKDQVPILKRYGGGGTVLLHPGCLVVSVGAWVSSPYMNDLYFRLLNNAIILTIQDQIDVDLGQRGHSDIVYGERKIAGTSLFRSRNYLLYQASLLIHNHIEDIEKYLKHPSKEPDYRQARRHRDFLSSLEDIQREVASPAVLSAADWLAHFNKNFLKNLELQLADQLIDPVEVHIPHLLKRAKLTEELSFV